MGVLLRLGEYNERQDVIRRCRFKGR